MRLIPIKPSDSFGFAPVKYVRSLLASCLVVLTLFSITLTESLAANRKRCLKRGERLLTETTPDLDGTSSDPFGQYEWDRSFSLVKTARSAGGTQGGEWYKDVDGKSFFGKSYGGNEERLIIENLANQIYKDMWLSTPETFLRRIQGKPILLSQEVEGSVAGSSQALMKSNVRDGFVVDAWIANWDVLGEDFDNVVIRDGKATRIDNGGTFYMRAQGGMKPFGNVVSEIDSMRGQLYRAGEVFSALSDAEIAGQIRKFLAKYSQHRSGILKRIKLSGLTAPRRRKLALTLDARARWLEGVALPRFHKAAVAKLGETEAATQELAVILGEDIWPSYVKDAQKKLQGVAAKLTNGELIALKEYTGGDFDVINDALRGGRENFSDWVGSRLAGRFAREAYMPYIVLATSALRKLPDFRGKVTRRVELNPSQLARYKVGAIIKEGAFTSTTYKGSMPYPGNVLFEIQSKHGKRIGFINPIEDEVLFEPGSKFKVTGRKFDAENEEWQIKLTELDE